MRHIYERVHYQRGKPQDSQEEGGFFSAVEHTVDIDIEGWRRLASFTHMETQTALLGFL
jgi:hypothetical protein